MDRIDVRKEEVVFERSIGQGRLYIRLTATSVGPDLLVSITGGTEPHIGAVAVGIPYAARSGQGYGASVSVHTRTGHKEDGLARWAADQIARSTGKVAVILAGIHIDQATPEEIDRLVTQSKQLVIVLRDFLLEQMV